MTNLKFQIIFFLFFLLFSCNMQNNNKRIERTVKQWYGRKIVFPDSLQLLQNNKLIVVDSTFFNYSHLKIITIVSGECEMCVEDIKRWFTFYDEIKEQDQETELYFVIENINFDYFMSVYYPEIPDNFKLIIDRDKRFYFKNEMEDLTYNTFLLNHDNEIILLGSPLFSKEFKKLYTKKLNLK